MIKIRPVRIPGRWREGYALDYHTISSVYIGDDEYGNPQFETKRSEVGELLFQLKYRSDRSVVDELVESTVRFFKSWNPDVNMLIPVPASRIRAIQPVLTLGEGLTNRIQLPFTPDCVKKSRDVPELKDVHEYDERFRILQGVHEVLPNNVEGRSILLFDDLYRSGATMNSITEVLYDQGGAAEVFALTMTRTRSKL